MRQADAVAGVQGWGVGNADLDMRSWDTQPCNAGQEFWERTDDPSVAWCVRVRQMQ